MTSSPTQTDARRAREHAVTRISQYEAQLMDLLRIESVSTQREHSADCQKAAQWLADDMKRIGLEHVEVCTTAGHPIVYADWLNAGPDAPTVLIYGHYDVQPPDPLDEWKSPPFQPTLSVDEAGRRFVVARGASDDKGQLFVHLKAAESLLSSNGRLPLNVRFFLEGEEESGSESLEQWVQENRDRLAADVCIISDTHMLGESVPSLITSLRGIAYCEVHCQGPSHDLHSGIYGGGVRNPAEALARVISQLKDEQGKILVPGFYDDVVELTVEDRTVLAAVPFDEDAFRSECGITETFGEHGYSVYEQVGARPTLEVNGFGSGYQGEGAKTVLPAHAMAKVSMRLVANQRWVDIADKFKTYVESLAPSGTTITVKRLHGGDPSVIDRSTPAMHSAATAIERVFGTPPVYCREGGSIPVVGLISQELEMPTVMVGFGLPDDRLHSPNEQFSLDQFRRGIDTVIELYCEL